MERHVPIWRTWPWPTICGLLAIAIPLLAVTYWRAIYIPRKDLSRCRAAYTGAKNASDTLATDTLTLRIRELRWLGYESDHCSVLRGRRN